MGIIIVFTILAIVFGVLYNKTCNYSIEFVYKISTVIAVIAILVLVVVVGARPSITNGDVIDKELIMASIANTNITERERLDILYEIEMFNNSVADTKAYIDNWWVGKYCNPWWTTQEKIDPKLLPPVKYNLLIDNKMFDLAL